MNDDRLASLRNRAKRLKSAGWYDEFDMQRIAEWIKTMDLLEVEAVVGWGEQDYRECKTVTPWMSEATMKKGLEESRANA